MAHSACPEEIDDLEAFLSKVLPPKGSTDKGDAQPAAGKASGGKTEL
jgi:hypothetical protein